jgi:hypothetical protein
MDQKKGIFKFIRVSRHGILGVTYHVFRVAEFTTLIAIIGLTASFVSDLVNAGVSPPSLLVAILSLVSPLLTYQPAYNSNRERTGLPNRTLHNNNLHPLLRPQNGLQMGPLLRLPHPSRSDCHCR